jgi:two-component system NtrC family sensor kinase
MRTTAGLLSEDPALRHVDMKIDGDAPLVDADADMLRIVFQNLLINSAQAMNGKGRITVSVEMVDSTCHISVADSGPGIPIEVRQKLFTPFFTTKSRGSGLGLSTVKRFVEAHGGDVAINCPVAGGTTVRIRLPVSSRASGQSDQVSQVR